MVPCRAYSYVHAWHGWKGSAQKIWPTFFIHACVVMPGWGVFFTYMCIAWWHIISKKESQHSNVTAHQPFCLSEKKNLCMQIRGRCASRPAFLVFLCGLGVWRVYAQPKCMHQWVSERVHMHASMYACVNLCIYVCHVCMCQCMYACMCACMCRKLSSCAGTLSALKTRQHILNHDQTCMIANTCWNFLLATYPKGKTWKLQG